MCKDAHYEITQKAEVVEPPYLSESTSGLVSSSEGRREKVMLVGEGGSRDNSRQKSSAASRSMKSVNSSILCWYCGETNG